MSKKRLDLYLVEKNFVASREKAQQLIMAGSVYINGRMIDKAGALVSEPEIVIKEKGSPYVSRGGVKLEHALNAFNLSVSGKVALDAGASTGGFTDCLIQKGAVKVYAVDVGYGQLAWKLFNHPDVVRIERTNIRYLKSEEIPEKADLITVDLSFISATLVLENLLGFLKPQGEMIVLIKPQFEVGKGLVGKGGIVKDPLLHDLAVQKVKDFGIRLGLSSAGIVESPILGQKGNKEFLIHFRKG
ncbi:MAG: TlyA family RNA methyltransferase [Nitrospirae bacterium]|nr:TlyA family RNA methyltransferase [Nitrospirota bacterium]MBI3594826.1 TlyA family RNA methyltransferase [Nitrospirota bacterium]